MGRDNDYTPLASYGPETNLVTSEALFSPHVTPEQVLHASREIHMTGQWPGFQFVVLMHDGYRCRALQFWRNRRVLDNFTERYQPRIFEYLASQSQDNPLVTGVDERRTGECEIHLVDASMPAASGEVVIWSPPGAVRICEMYPVEDIEQIRQWLLSISAPSVEDALVQVAGFQFFTAVRLSSDYYITYLGFRSHADLDNYLRSDLHAAHDVPFNDTGFRARTEVTIHTGDLIAWFQRQVV